MPMEQAPQPQHTQLSRSLSWWERSIVKRSTYAIYNQVDTAMEESPFLRRHEQQHSNTDECDNNDDELPQEPPQAITPKSDILTLDRSQVQVGVMLGKGSFSIVSEVIGFDLDEEADAAAAAAAEECKRDLVRDLDNSSRHMCLSSIMLSPLMEQEEEEEPEEPSYKHGKYAIKHLRPDLIPKSGDPEHFQAAAADLIMEAKYLAALDHPGILKLRAVAHGGAAAFQNSGGQYDGFFIVTDRLNGTLKDKILDWQCIQQEESLLECLQMAGRDQLRLQQEHRDPACQEETKEEEDNDASCRTMDSILGKTNPRRVLLERLDIALQLGKALAYLHDRRLIFRDLKPANVGLTEDNQVKLFDFGFTRQLPSCDFMQYDHQAQTSATADDEDVDDDDQVYFMSGKGSLMYLAPEVLYNGRYNRKADCYSFAMVFYELLTLHKPFGNVMNQEVFRELICRHKVRPSLEFAEDQQIPASIQDLLRHSWEHSVSQRWTMRQICDRLEEIMLELHQEPPSSFVPLVPTTVMPEHSSSTSSGHPLCNGGGLVVDMFQGFARDIKLGFKILMGDTKSLQQEDFQSRPLEVTLSGESGDDGYNDSMAAVMDEIVASCHSVTTQETAVDSVSLVAIQHQGTIETESSSRSNLMSSSPSLRVSVITITPMTATEEPLEVTLEQALSMTFSSYQKENLPITEEEEEEEERFDDEQEDRCPPSPPLSRTTSAPVQNSTSSKVLGDIQVPCYELPAQTPPRQPFSRRQSCNGGADKTVVKISQRQPQRRQSYHGAMYLQEENQQWMSTTPAA